MSYNAKTVIRMFRNEDGQVCAHVEKDRTHVHEDNTTIEDPTLVDWQAVIDKTAGRKEFVVKNDLTKSVETEQNLYEKEVLGRVGESVDELPSDTPVQKPSVDIEALKKEIVAKRNALSPLDKKAMKEKLEKAGLPIAYKNVTDPNVLQQVLDCFE